jgi:hypothetical protein
MIYVIQPVGVLALLRHDMAVGMNAWCRRATFFTAVEVSAI